MINNIKNRVFEMSHDLVEEIESHKRYLIFIFITSIFLILIHKVLSPFLWINNVDPALVQGFTEWVTPWITEFTDGIEFYYYSFFTFFSAIIMLFISQIPNFNPEKKLTLYSSLIFFTLTILWYKQYPIFPILHNGMNLSVIISILSTVFFIVLFSLMNTRFEYLYLVIFLIFIIFFQSLPFSYFNNSFYFYPAFQYLNGKNLLNTIMQYDLLSTYVAYLFIRSKSALENFSFYISALNFIGLLFLYYSLQNIFNKKTAFLSVIFFILFNFFANYSEMTYIPQTNFWRIDSWYFLFVAILWWGCFNWKTIVLIFLLSFLNQGFGILSVCGWITYNLIDFINFDLKKEYKKLLGMIAVILISLLIQNVFQNEHLKTFVSLKVGFLKITEHSVIWFLLPVIWLPFRFKFQKFSNEKRLLAIFAIFLLPYFWGRSDEYNLLRSSLPIIILVSLFLSELKSWSVLTLIFVFMANYQYSNSIKQRVSERFIGLLSLRPIIKDNVPIEIKKIVDDNLEKKIITCFPDSGYDLYLKYNDYKGYSTIPGNIFSPCNFIITEKLLTKYQDQLSSYGFGLEIVRGHEF